jgi:hypothetical protein
MEGGTNTTTFTLSLRPFQQGNTDPDRVRKHCGVFAEIIQFIEAVDEKHGQPRQSRNTRRAKLVSVESFPGANIFFVILVVVEVWMAKFSKGLD